MEAATISMLNSYQDWKHCITVKCAIPLTEGFIRQRLAELRDPANHATRKFVENWGDRHRLKIIGWFEQAERELAA